MYMPYKDPEKKRQHNRERYHINKEKNREKKRERDKKYYERNRDKVKTRVREYTKNNKETQNKWERNKRKIDPIYRNKKNLRRRIQDMLKSKKSIKSSGTFQILGIDKEGFIRHIESQWEPWMSWDNYGLYNKNMFNYGWDIDHIIPSSTALTEEDIYKLNHYTNLRPLCSKVNRDIKRDLPTREIKNPLD